MVARRICAVIGSRKTPPAELALMQQTATILYERGWTQRTGGAPGADQAFMAGLSDHARQSNLFELYLPWPGFEGFTEADARLVRPTPRAYDIASQYHPYWVRCSRGAKALLARDSHQILGPDCDDPIQMVICWTPDGSLDGQGRKSGGTGMALRITAGEAPDALVFNLARPEHRERITQLVA